MNLATRSCCRAWVVIASSIIAISRADVPVRVTIDVAHPQHVVSPMLHGIFFEDINYAADGGLYAELVQNRSFEHSEELFAWGTVSRKAKGTVAIESESPLNEKNPHYARLDVHEPGSGFGLANYGYAGIPLRSGENYLVSVRGRSSSGGKLRAILEDETGRALATTEMGPLTSVWQKYEARLAPTGAATHGRLVVLATTAGRTDIDVVSLFPEGTFKHRQNGLRADLAQMLADLKPAFVRFPGGCIVEGNDLPNRYQWKDTIGDIAERPQNWNRWQTAIKHSTAPQYYQTYGLGFFEYFQFCEDIGAEPVPILNCGMACQYESKQLVPVGQLDSFVQDALDLIEFANGPVTSKWGAKRAALGHPAPFQLKYIGVGNEQWGEAYFERYTVFSRALKATHPEINLVSGAGPGVDDESWQLAWQKFRSGTVVDVVDEHYYRPPQWFLENATRYDRQDRSGPKVFAGEFAAHESGGRSTLRAAVSEAAFMTGLLRNSDVVSMSSYAPLFAREGANQWAPDLIWFNNASVFGTPSYYVQALFGRNRPTRLLPVNVEGDPVNFPRLPAKAVATYGADPLPPYRPAFIPTLFAAAGRDEKNAAVVVFLVNPFAESRAATIQLSGPTTTTRNARAFILTSSSGEDVNTFTDPRKVVPHEESFTIEGQTIQRSLPPYSLTVMRLSE